ncbi:hypothetical protein HDK77DRAFT_464206 [Phyllosticta capitalensis]|uniref:NECAP PHear domain-containing protein n=1 Tax=Phyllosticta capitalensis TaxID=121624 RepID=A0ABR1YQN1_9PEZI
METIDPTTGKALPPDAIQRVLYIARQVHIYQIPPATSTKGYNASTWMGPNNERMIFTARLRVLETAIPKPRGASQSGPATATADDREEDVKVDILLEDPATGQLFAGAPYTAPAVVEPTLDSSRFFAVRVVGDGRKATLGVGFEERSDAMDFNIALQDARKVLGFDQAPGARKGAAAAKAKAEREQQEKRDFSLKEGETITVNIGRRGRRKPGSPGEGAGEEQKDSSAALFSIKPPPPAGGNGAMPFLPPPPKTSDVKAERRRSRNMQLGTEAPKETLTKQPSAQELGFDDGEFGEFQ